MQPMTSLEFLDDLWYDKCSKKRLLGTAPIISFLFFGINLAGEAKVRAAENPFSCAALLFLL